MGNSKPISLNPGSTVAEVRILPEGNGFLTIEIGGPKYPAPGVMIVEGGGAVYLRDAKDGRVLYKVADVTGIWGSIDLSNDGKTIMLADWDGGGSGVRVRFFRR